MHIKCKVVTQASYGLFTRQTKAEKVQLPSANKIEICMRRRMAASERSVRLARRAIKNAGRRGWESAGGAGPRPRLPLARRRPRAAPGERARGAPAVAAARRASLLTTHVASAPYGPANVIPTRTVASPCERRTVILLCTVNEGSASCTRRRKTTC